MENMEGKIKIEKYKDSKKNGKVFGTYDIAEQPNGRHTGIFTGKFTYSFKWNKKTEQIEQQIIKFEGIWKSYDGTLQYKTKWSNQK